MALIECNECGKKVSDKALSCPECGYPIADEAEVEAIGTPVTTMQETSKAIKSHIVFAVFLIVGGCTTSVVSGSDGSENFGVTIGIWLMLAGFIWYLISQVRSWWHHG